MCWILDTCDVTSDLHLDVNGSLAFWRDIMDWGRSAATVPLLVRGVVGLSVPILAPLDASPLFKRCINELSPVYV